VVEDERGQEEADRYAEEPVGFAEVDGGRPEERRREAENP